MDFICPKDSNILSRETSGFLCAKCSSFYPLIDGVPNFVKKDFYWGEIPQAGMESLLAIIKQDGYQAGLDYLDKNFPGRSKFVFDVTRSDWRWPIDIQPGMKILDLGCGWGTHTFPLANLDTEVYAVDLTKQRVDFVEARKRFENRNNIFPLVANVMELPFSGESFDLIVSNGVLEWVGLQTEFGGPVEVQIKFLQKMRNLLKPGGVLYIGIENRYAQAYFYKGIDHSGIKYTSLLPRFLANLYTKWKIKKPYITYTYSHTGFINLFKKSGFTKVETYLPFPGYNNPISLVPYDDFNSFKFFLKTRGRIAKIKPEWLKNLLLNKFFVKLYRFFIYSFAFYLKK